MYYESQSVNWDTRSGLLGLALGGVLYLPCEKMFVILQRETI